MGRSFGLLTLIVVVAIGGYVYMRQAQSLTTVGSNPQTTIDVTAVRNDLIALANAERNYFASNGKYASLDQLRGDVSIPARPNYSYSAETADAGFRVIAVYSGSDPKAPKRLVIDETMSITTN